MDQCFNTERSTWRRPLFHVQPAICRHKRRKLHRHAKPDFAWSPAFDPAGRKIEGRQYDRLVWYGEERWEYEQDVRLTAIAYNHDTPDQIVKIRLKGV